MSPTRLETPVDQVGSSVTVITAEEIERKQYRFVVDALQQVPGVTVRRDSGRPGARTSVFIRGMSSSQTLVLIDGVAIHDSAAPNREPLLSNLPVDNVERIEVLRGPQSTLYGSEAIGGVISITTKKGKGEGRPTLDGWVEGGSHETINGGGGVNGTVGPFDYSVTASHTHTGGFSAVPGSDDDGFDDTAVAARIGYRIGEHAGVDVFARYLDTHLDIDSGFDPSLSTSKTQQLILKAEPHLELFDGFWKQKLGIWFHGADRHNQGVASFLPSKFDGQNYGLDWQHDLRLNEMHTVVLGFHAEEEDATFQNPGTGKVDADTRNFAGYLQDRVQLWDRLFITGGFRIDGHEDFGTEPTWRFTGAYQHVETDTIVRASGGSAFKAPSLAQLFDTSFASPTTCLPFCFPFLPNPDLDPEESIGVDAGLEQRLWEGRVTFGATYFWNEIDDLIAFVSLPSPGPGVFPGTLVNVDKVRTQGVETTLTIEPIAGLAFSANYTYTNTKVLRSGGTFSLARGESLLRRPEHQAYANLTWRFLDERARLGISMNYVGERRDLGGVDLDDYVVVDLRAAFRINERVEVYARVENLFDEDYQDVLGFKTSGIAAFGGMRLRF